MFENKVLYFSLTEDNTLLLIFKNLIIFKNIYFWLHWVSTAAHGLLCGCGMGLCAGGAGLCGWGTGLCAGGAGLCAGGAGLCSCSTQAL